MVEKLYVPTTDETRRILDDTTRAGIPDRRDFLRIAGLATFSLPFLLNSAGCASPPVTSQRTPQRNILYDPNFGALFTREGLESHPQREAIQNTLMPSAANVTVVQVNGEGARWYAFRTLRDPEGLGDQPVLEGLIQGGTVPRELMPTVFPGGIDRDLYRTQAMVTNAAVEAGAGTYEDPFANLQTVSRRDALTRLELVTDFRPEDINPKDPDGLIVPFDLLKAVLLVPYALGRLAEKTGVPVLPEFFGYVVRYGSTYVDNLAFGREGMEILRDPAGEWRRDPASFFFVPLATASAVIPFLSFGGGHGGSDRGSGGSVAAGGGGGGGGGGTGGIILVGPGGRPVRPR
ncbi:MAG: hypothetical protein HYS32_03175 [Candidatus Woesearchaeota archaeon]|nr:MAG: hypothetical protein HYS32_03175 [Candidatus Woesearchaeota archaeon]